MGTDRLMAIDPGNDLGWAWFISGRLTQCGMLKTKGIWNPFYNTLDGHAPTRLVIEIPQVYPQQRTEPNDLIKVAQVCGKAELALGRKAEVIHVFPHAWKGTRPKKVDNKVTMKILDYREVIVFDKACPGAYEKIIAGTSAGAAHNVADAIGIGLWALKRR